jgi:hypothetical protein
MKKSLLFIICIYSFIGANYGQDYGIVINSSLNTIRTTGSEDFKALIGYGIGFYVEEQSNNWSFLGEISFQRKGAKFESVLDSEYKIDSKFIHTKLLFNYYLNDEVEEINSPFIGFGVYLGPRVDNKEVISVNGEESTVIDELTIIGFDAGLLLSLGYRLDKLSISLRTGLGLLDIMNENNVDGEHYHFEIIGLNLGYEF